jgi:hypothetical protein
MMLPKLEILCQEGLCSHARIVLGAVYALRLPFRRLPNITVDIVTRLAASVASVAAMKGAVCSTIRSGSQRVVAARCLWCDGGQTPSQRDSDSRMSLRQTPMNRSAGLSRSCCLCCVGMNLDEFVTS